MAYDLPLLNREVGVIALKNILVATDFSESADAALRYGMELARKYGAALHVLHVVEDLAVHPGPIPGLGTDNGPLQTALEDGARANLASLVPERERARLRTRLHVMVASAAGRAILSYARDSEIDLIVVGTHGRHGLQHFFLGSVAQQVSRLAECPVLTVRAHERDFVHPDVLKPAVTVSGTHHKA